MKFEQERDAAPITQALLGLRHALPVNVMRDALLSLVILRYTQSNAIALVKDGVSLGIGAGQQNRVDCVRLAAAKARIWWLRRHTNVRNLRDVRAMTSNDRLNWQIRYAEGTMISRQSREFAALFGVEAAARLRIHAFPHQARTTFATFVRDRLERANAAGRQLDPVKIVQSLLAHADAATTEAYLDSIDVPSLDVLRILDDLALRATQRS
jgi:AICAR transformylase/IMP cyclohydrolase PurH